MVVAVGGGMASGKSSLADGLEKALAWPRVSFGEHVRTVAATRRLNPDDRAVLQAVGESLIAGGWENFCAAVLAARPPGTSNLIVEGIRHREALTTIRRLLAPDPVVFVFVRVPKTVQDARLVSRGIEDADERRKVLDHSTETQSSDLLPTLADLVVDGTNLESAVGLVVQWISIHSNDPRSYVG